MIPRKILFCTDFSENSEPARKTALDYAKAFNAELIVVHVIDGLTGLPVEDPTFQAHVGEVLQHMKDRADARLEQISRDCADVLKAVKTYSRTGSPAQEIVHLANEESVDLITMGTHGWTGIRHILLGSVAEKVLRTAKCPVLVVRS